MIVLARGARRILLSRTKVFALYYTAPMLVPPEQEYINTLPVIASWISDQHPVTVAPTPLYGHTRSCSSTHGTAIVPVCATPYSSHDFSDFETPCILDSNAYASESYKLHAIGLISDTHGLLRPEAVRALAGVRHIIHAGDIGGPEILAELSKIAPVYAVRGNNDKGAWAAQIPLYLALELEGVSIHVLHDVKEIDIDPKAAGFDVVIAGHSHKPDISERDGVIFINPGSAGPRRFSLPVTVGYLDIATGAPSARIMKIL